MARLRSVHIAAAAAVLLVALARCVLGAPCTPARRWAGGGALSVDSKTRPRTNEG